MEPFFGEVGGLRPRVAPDAFVAPGAVLVGGVRVGARSSVWYGSVLRADDEEVVVGEGCNIQDLCLMHADPGYPAVLEDGVSVGHRAIVHGATVREGSLVGMGAVLLNGVVLGPGSVVAAGAVVTPGTEIPSGSLVAGVPARVVRPAREADREMIRHTARSYLRKSGLHREARPLRREEVEAG
ncbi:carbonic anhydrase/acetyltransferase isoleucine patch superfamily-like protein [Rubrobacter xylanophilus DSM 9941]|uniref:Carbonic anhydrase/acetyltransferase isoleucine patch superfamily-like protein n=1 Tax=Rubrobacter xylanophilus (strain DSM 9941 / JCM 11954 / NBRC 16129 / PRD-1) TaxID=266117 RepID=Q1AZF5_RUBXD|nr:carbonic anhydrase/acetyltransferase isoleucine patch superfamily-like protein [Rubrobacter xylanophilus DSM 9941]